MQCSGADERASRAYRATVRDYRRLDVWQKAHTLALNVRRAVRDFTRKGYVSFKSQIVEAAESVPLNIVEGCGTASQKEVGRFLDMAIKSSCELEYQFQLARDYGILPQFLYELLTGDCIEVRRMLCGLRRKILDDLRRPDRRASDDKVRRNRSTADGSKADCSRLGSPRPTRGQPGEGDSISS